MTIGIAAICNWDGNSEAIVTASDHMISTGDFSADNMVPKIEPIHPQWETMFAANDIKDVEPILNAVRLRVANRPPSKMGLRQIVTAFSKAYQTCLSENIEQKILAPLGMKHSEFIKAGLKKLGMENFSNILNEVRAAHFECEFLVCGFGADGEPHIFTMSGIGEIGIRDRLGFWAIGTGQPSALSSLFFHSYNRNRGPVSAIYHVCEAKFMSETAMGVGKEPTFVSLHHDKNQRAYVYEYGIDSIRDFWKKGGCPRVPEGVLQYIGKECVEQYDPSTKTHLRVKLL